jgi:hypothetical protein
MSRRLSGIDKLKLAKLRDDGRDGQDTTSNGKTQMISFLGRGKYDSFHPLRRKFTILPPKLKKHDIDPNHGYPTAEASNPFLLSPSPLSLYADSN